MCHHVEAALDALQAETERLRDVIAKHNIAIDTDAYVALQAETERLREEFRDNAPLFDDRDALRARVSLLEGLLEASAEAENVLILLVSASHNKGHARGAEWVSREEIIGEDVVFWLDRIKAAQASLFQARHAALSRSDQQ